MNVPAHSPVVFDCMTFLQATTSPSGPGAACFRLVEEDGLPLAISDEILAEVRNVLSRPRVRRRNPQLTDEQVEQFLAHLTALVTPKTAIPAVFRYSRDPKDEPYLNLAIAVQAAYLVSFDDDLLDLMKDDNSDGQVLRALAPNLVILTPPEFLRVVSATKPLP